MLSSQPAMLRLETQCQRFRWVTKISPTSLSPQKPSQISFAGETSAPMNFKNSLLVTVPEGHEELEVKMTAAFMDWKIMMIVVILQSKLVCNIELVMMVILQVSCTASNSAGSATETATVSVHSKFVFVIVNIFGSNII